MTSVTNSSGLNYQNGINPLGRKVRALEAEVISLRSEINLLKSGGVVQPTSQQNSSTSAPVASNVSFELDMIKRELAVLKASGFGKGEKGDKGDKGEKGEKGDPGPMTYIAMPSNATAPMVAPAPAPLAQQVMSSAF
jgi:hypothetical protein